MNTLLSYSEPFECYSFDCDVNRCMQPGAILRYMQQVAIRQCDLMGMNEEFYRTSETAFLLAKQTLEILHPIAQGTHFTVTTTPTGMNRAVYRRYTQLTDAEGNLCAVVDSLWMLVDTSTRRILRREPECYRFITWPAELEAAPLNMDIAKAEETVEVGYCKAGYSLCDENGHLNNTRYVDLFMDAMPPAALLGRRVKKITVVYHKEVPLNSSFLLQRGDLGPMKWYFCGSDGGRSCVEANFELEADK